MNKKTYETAMFGTICAILVMVADVLLPLVQFMLDFIVSDFWTVIAFGAAMSLWYAWEMRND